MDTEKKIWNELLDADTAAHLVSAQSFINGLNLRFGSTDDGYIGFFESIKGNTERANTLPAGDNICIGACGDETNRWAIFFNWNENDDHGIYLYDIASETMYKVVEDADVTGGLNFDKYKLINGAFVVNGILYFNDGTEDGQRRMNLGVFMDAQGSSPVTADYSITLPIDAHEITLIKKPCSYPPSVSKKYDNTFNNNFIGNNSFKFAVEYSYYDGEEAVLSGWSRSTLFNQASDNYNYIQIKLDITETVPQTVRLVRLVMLDESSQKAFVVKQWDREISADNTNIDNQNLVYNFYGNITGEAVDSATTVRPFHSVPIKSGTMELAKNRVNLSDNTKGYNTPGITSLSLSLPSPVALGFSSLTKTVVEIKHRNGRAGAESYAYIGLFVYLTEVPLVGWYLINTYENLNTANGTYGSVSSPPASVAFSGLTFKGYDLTAVVLATAESGTWRWDGPFVTYTVNTINITGISTNTYTFMLPQSQIKGGIVFMDKYLRRCAVIEKDEPISIPKRDYSYSSGYASVDWTLSNAAAATEIPDWAYYYAVVRTLNLRTRFFIAAYDEATKYATRNTTTGLLEYTTTTFSTNVVAIAIDTSALLRAGLGYSFSEGDQCILIKSGGANYDLPVIGQDGQYILLKAYDIGTLNTSPSTTVKFVYEIYTPHKTSEQEPFFEVGELFAITNPGEAGREYSVLQGSFRGDIVVFNRNYNATSYYAEAMNPNDTYYQRWHTDAGRINILSKLGQVRKKTSICFSNVWIPGTQNNGLSAFEAINEEILPEEMGVIQKLVLASKSQQEGSVMLAIGENQTASIYLGEVQIFDANNNAFLAKASGYIGQVNILKGRYGTQNPESVAVDREGRVYWVDIRNYAVIRYDMNGLIPPISDFKMSRAMQLFCKKYMTLSTGDIETLGSRPFIFGGIDNYNGEYLIAIPATEAEPPKGWLDYGQTGVVATDLYSVKNIAESGGYYQAFSAYAVYLTGVNPAGWYIITSTETTGSIAPAEPTYPALPAAPTAEDFANLQYAGATEADMLQYISNRLPVYFSDPQVSYLSEVADTGSNIDIDTEGDGYIYPYDIYDGRAKVLVFRTREGKWAAPHGYEPEMFCSAGNNLFAFKSGAMWENNTNISYNTFFGVAGKSRIAGVARNPNSPSKIQVFKTVSVEANMAPTFFHLRTETPNIQSTDLIASDFDEREGIYYGGIMRDRLSPNVTGNTAKKQRFGDTMRGPWAYFLAEWDTQSLLQLKFINFGYRVTAGHEFV